MQKKQLEQDSQYNFPYHYIPTFGRNFTQNFNWAWGKQYASAIEFILDEIKKNDTKISSIADLGCGDGRLTKELNLSFKEKDIIGIDYSSKAINLAKALNPDVNYQSIDIIDTDYHDKFDAITLIEVFEHIPLEQCELFVLGMKKILNNGGIVYLTVPHVNIPLNSKHFQHFSFESLIKYFEKDFDLLEFKYIQKNNKFLKLINIFMANKHWIINNNYLNNLLYKFYKKYYFFGVKDNCARIYMKLQKK